MVETGEINNQKAGINPLVTVGIPTYNRPEGLRRTLECITGQTYRNLEIIISDNCSPNPDAEIVGRKFVAKDPRVQYFRQKENTGGYNFQFLIEKATGEYFMWAADDDEWLPEFIEVNVRNIGDAGSSMTDYIERNRILKRDKYIQLPQLCGVKKNKDARIFLRNLCSPMVYGLHKKKTILWVINTNFFDFWDCYFSFRQIVDYGYNVYPGYLYISGIDTADYVYKPCHPDKKRLFQYFPFFKHCFVHLVECHTISRFQKIVILCELISITFSLFSSYERKSQPIKFFFIKFVCIAYSIIRRIIHKVC